MKAKNIINFKLIDTFVPTGVILHWWLTVLTFLSIVYFEEVLNKKISFNNFLILTLSLGCMLLGYGIIVAEISEVITAPENINFFGLFVCGIIAVFLLKINKKLKDFNLSIFHI